MGLFAIFFKPVIVFTLSGVALEHRWRCDFLVIFERYQYDNNIKFIPYSEEICEMHIPNLF